MDLAFLLLPAINTPPILEIGQPGKGGVFFLYYVLSKCSCMTLLKWELIVQFDDIDCVSVDRTFDSKRISFIDSSHGFGTIAFYCWNRYWTIISWTSFVVLYYKSILIYSQRYRWSSMGLCWVVFVVCNIQYWLCSSPKYRTSYRFQFLVRCSWINCTYQHRSFSLGHVCL